ncbi:MAG: mandelate racemase/muconate lactonizing enzyme family protein [Bryobacterales bacterium]
MSCALSGLEQACYDIQGKLMGVPCWALFGGKLRDEVRNYANINRATDVRTPEGFAALAKSAVESGFDAVKMASFDGMPKTGAAEIEAHTKLGVDCIKAVREVLGPDRDLLVDAHSNFDYNRGLDLFKRLEPLHLFWLEEVSRPLDVWAKLSAEAPMTTAGGESLFGVKEFWPYLKADACDIMMPDVKYCGGMLELKKISAMSEAAGDHPVAPHGPSSPIGNMAAAHVCVTIPNFSILEFSHGDALEWRADMTIPPEPMGKGGMLRVPDTPGLGYELNEKVVRPRLVS